MKKLVTVLLLAVAITDHAEKPETPFQPFSTDKNFSQKVTITWIPVDNIKATCEKESRRRGYGGFGGVALEACSFWEKGFTGNSCTIYTERNVNMWAVGHEVRHCYQGAFH